MPISACTSPLTKACRWMQFSMGMLLRDTKRMSRLPALTRCYAGRRGSASGNRHCRYFLNMPVDWSFCANSDPAFSPNSFLLLRKQSMTNIYHLTDALPYSHPVWGGAEQLTAKYISALRNRSPGRHHIICLAP